MALEPNVYDRLSRSTQRAAGYAAAAARHRREDVSPEDLLVGALLAHAGGGEVQVLFGYLGITVRDLARPSYPTMTLEDLERAARGLSPDGPPPMDAAAERIVRAALEFTNGSALAQVRHLLAALIDPASPLRDPFTAALSRAGWSYTPVLDNYRGWLSAMDQGADEAGRYLDSHLHVTLPRRPVEYAKYAADNPSSTGDLIGIRTEVDAFAYLLASKALQPPLAVGLFGEWGSGKSFFMLSVQERVKQIKEKAGNSSPFWSSIEQIPFNAWEYAQSDLWASLVHHIFKALEGQPSTLVDARRAELEEEQKQLTDEAARLDAEEAGARATIAQATTAVDAAEAQRDEAVQALRVQKTEQLSEDLRERARTALAASWNQQADKLLGSEVKDLVGAVADARNELARTRGLLGRYWTRPRILVATVIALLVPGLAFVLDRLGAPPVSVLLGGLLPLVPAVTAMLRSATTWSRAQLADLEQVIRDIEASFQAAVDAEDVKVADARAALAAAEATRASAAAARSKADAQAERLQETITNLTAGTVLAEFLRDSSRSEAYRRHLGLMSRVRDDLKTLEGLMRAHNEELLTGKKRSEDGEQPPSRIILYIDDLDRCPSDKVVEVLEAVHLLLAFELFVVVVAVDARWLSFALTDELAALSADDSQEERATPQDYLEKIFQLPFWVQPLRTSGREALVRRLMEGSVGAGDDAARDDTASELTFGADEQNALAAMLRDRGAVARLEANALVLLPSDLVFLDTLAPLLGDTPRRVKRFVNIVQLVLAMPPELEVHEREAVMFCAALNSGLPELASRLFDAVPRRRDVTLGTALGAHPKLSKWLKDRGWEDEPLSRLEVRLDIVRRLSFTPPQ